MPTLDRDGVAIYYEDNGQKGDGRTAILLTHGFGASTGMWQGQVETFGDRFRMVAWDMRGHGQSGGPDDLRHYGQDLTVADMAALLDHLGIGKAIIAGHSLGGFMSLRFHAAHPDRVLGLILQGTGPGFRNEAARETWNENARQRADTIEAEGFKGGGSEVGKGKRGTPKGLANAARGMLAHVDAKVIDSLPDIAVPTIIIVGANDANFLGAAEYMEKKVAGATRLVVPDAGHGCNIDQPEIVNEALEGYLAAF